MIPKFRVWLPDVNKMLNVKALIFEKNKTRCMCGYAYNFYLEDENATVMQSTGLFDKNGVEVFEGDVAVMNGWRRQVVTFGTQEVEEDFGSVRIYRGFNLYLGGGYPNAVMSEFEVVGNIYENPELMEGNA
ncbi:YopX family protein [Streptococcus constellatus]|uniref:YopX family protein n=1 Tax=Streptococcus constellatus TaxID=76860 RepID=UPI00069F1753|nr:YopX family protein [Streptococcus constellatus]